MQANPTIIPDSLNMLKILPIYRRNILRKQLCQVICFKYVFRLFHASKFQILSTKLNIMVKVVSYFSKSEATVHRCLWKSYSFSIKFYSYSPKKNFYTGVFLWVKPNICQTNTPGWLPLLNTLSCPLLRPQPKELFSSKYFQRKHCESLTSSSSWKS